jgi:serine/threonine-protein kinase
VDRTEHRQAGASSASNAPWVVRGAVLAILLAILAVLLWSYRGASGALEQSRRVELRSLLAGSIEAVESQIGASRERDSATASAPAGQAGRPDLDSVLKAARIGQSGETFVFDSAGAILAGSRHHVAGAGSASTRRLVVGSGGEARTDEVGPVQTRLAAEALGGRTESDSRERRCEIVEPYPGYWGVDVIGAWQWLPEHDLGVAVEMPALEAYAPLRFLETGGAAAGVLILIGCLAVFVSPAAMLRSLRGGQALRQVGPYRLVRQIGEGAISNIFLARHRHLSRPAAVKILKPQSTTDEWIARFEREVQLASALRHPNTIAVYDYGKTANGVFYFAMEYLEGLALSDLVTNYGPLPPARAAYLMRQVCASLAEAHASNLIHRDIKPQNIMTCELHGERDVVKVLDFGLVKRLDGADTRDLTRSLRILGTPLYMAPERIHNPSDVGPRTDIYSLGAVGYFLLTGKRLYETDNDHDLTYHILHVPAPRASEHAPRPVPPELDELIAQCLAKDPADRPADVGAVAARLDRVLAEHPWTERQIDAWWRKNWIGPDHPDRRHDVA